MVDELKLKLIRKKPTMEDLVKSKVDSNTDIVFRVAMVRSNRDQEKILKEASTIR
ncbi:hypothetical protein IJG78_01505 [Candidatus Saccharibacteria bacterium]|nr:hypothetical protein [Candidatus Saccharibacteria bacterium]